MSRSPLTGHGGTGPLSQEAALELVVRALRRRGLSERAVRERLRDAGATPALEDETIATVVRLGYLDDHRLACDRANRLAARGYGNAAVDARLANDGIDTAARQAALSALEPEGARARRVVASERRRNPSQLAAFLARRGFEHDAIEAALLGAGDLDAPGAARLP
jgi:SOS response regulatory protein OraA/RecX